MYVNEDRIDRNMLIIIVCKIYNEPQWEKLLNTTHTGIPNTERYELHDITLACCGGEILPVASNVHGVASDMN